MAHAEDTELGDLVIEALEKNGSLAKVRALLRANVFLAFEEDSANLKHNINLDNILELPEGVLCLQIVHEFLEFCNLKNSLFVYVSESRQKREYDYEGQCRLAEKLHIDNRDNVKEPILLTLIKNFVKPYQGKYFQKTSAQNPKKHERNFKDDENCTYIVHEDTSSSATSTSQSDNSSDEKNKLHLQLPLDNSDTDTSTDSARDKSCSEYIPNEHVTINDNISKTVEPLLASAQHKSVLNDFREGISPNYLRELKLINNSGSDSTSYIELKPFNALDEKLLNTPGIPFPDNPKKQIPLNNEQTSDTKSVGLQEDTPIANLMSSVTSMKKISIRNENEKSLNLNLSHLIEDTGKSDTETVEYSNDFSSSLVTTTKDEVDHSKILQSLVEEPWQSPNKDFIIDSPHQHSQSSQSSVSISDVADLISGRSSYDKLSDDGNNSLDNLSKLEVIKKTKKSSVQQHNKASDDSAEFSDSPIPSLSNLSLDIHSE